MNRSAAGLDIGLLGNITQQSFTGAAVSLLFNYNKIAADIIGFQVAGLANIMEQAVHFTEFNLNSTIQ